MCFCSDAREPRYGVTKIHDLESREQLVKLLEKVEPLPKLSFDIVPGKEPSKLPNYLCM